MSEKYGGRLKKEDWFVERCSLKQARELVESYHYARGGANTATELHGIYRKGEYKPLGAAWWLPPTRTAAAAWWHNPEEVLNLSRLVLSPEVPKNGATFLLMRSVKMLDSRWRCLLTYADEWQGHVGHIYKAAGWEYLGKTSPERTYIIDGVMTARKAGPKTRTHEEMLALGAEMIGSFARFRFRYVRPQSKRKEPKAKQVRLL